MNDDAATEAAAASAMSDDFRQELEEARAHQHAASEVLKVIAESSNNTQLVFDAIVKASLELCDAAHCSITLFDGKDLHVVATHNISTDVLEAMHQLYPAPPNPERNTGRAFLNQEVVMVEDLWADATYPTHDLARRADWRCHMSVPMVRRGESVGVIAVARSEPKRFSDSQVQILKIFAQQATVAIDNASLFDQLEELNQSLEGRVQEQVAELERVGRLRRFLPRQLADVVINSGDESILDSHRREVSVVFCDLRGFTAFSEIAEPEEVISVLGQYHEVAGPLIENHGGTLERFLGDGLMVLFNDPIPCENPVRLAVTLAVELRDAMLELSKQWSNQGYLLGFGVGIAHGFATLGRIGFEGRTDYTAIGSVVNQASRLCDEAAAGEIIVTQRIANVAKDIVEVAPLGELALKGLRQPVRAFRLDAIVSS